MPRFRMFTGTVPSNLNLNFAFYGAMRMPLWVSRPVWSCGWRNRTTGGHRGGRTKKGGKGCQPKSAVYCVWVHKLMMPDMTEHVDRHITVAPYLLYFSKPYLRSVRRIGREVQGWEHKTRPHPSSRYQAPDVMWGERETKVLTFI